MCQAREIMDGGRGQPIPLVAAAEYYPGQAHFKGPEADVRMAESCVKTAVCAQETDEPTSLSSKERCTIGSVERFEGRVRRREALHIPRAQTKVLRHRSCVHNMRGLYLTSTSSPFVHRGGIAAALCPSLAATTPQPAYRHIQPRCMYGLLFSMVSMRTNILQAVALYPQLEQASPPCWG
ncbi:hypothetical protein CI102_612 [Trichoderma harzianum]|uniref:Uncharacterized protein n=1 Tax=Trichoderma harzianum CBS 226.95 TaxID=983964 RepID=A0A2T4AFB2_TRIHA|nr:hypothetical protein M431DRAFT_408943 [Trichoderma harzianum CBS 226.95]PKK54660.1 hypothetical protein CI102_612 [Trichoderma harzianum]PTB55785.1 hypothetical protein M431DRAFT_408943 [Trichoderma harzianum CBS 226.95]